MNKRRKARTVSERVERLREIKEEMLALLTEAGGLVRGTHEEDRARSYWLAHIRIALDDEHMYLGGSMGTLQSSIDALEDEEDDE